VTHSRPADSTHVAGHSPRSETHGGTHRTHAPRQPTGRMRRIGHSGHPTISGTAGTAGTAGTSGTPVSACPAVSADRGHVEPSAAVRHEHGNALGLDRRTPETDRTVRTLGTLQTLGTDATLGTPSRAAMSVPVSADPGPESGSSPDPVIAVTTTATSSPHESGSSPATSLTATPVRQRRPTRLLPPTST
jgi:hypothetical protein